MKRKFIIIFILLSMVVNFFSFSVMADDCPPGYGDDGSGNCVWVSSEDYTNIDSNRVDEDEPDWTNLKDPYYSADGKTMCKVRVSKTGEKEPYECYRVDANGNIDYSHKVTIPPMKDLQVVSDREVVFNKGTSYHPLTPSVDDLFDTSLKDGDMDNPIGWALTRNTYIVVKEVEGKGKQVFWNTPNVPQLIYNIVLKAVVENDGYAGEAYNVKETEKFVTVGTSENYMRRYGFRIPNIKYVGEYPLYFMSMNTLLPTTPFKAIVRAFGSAVSGSSFINAPNKETYASLTYLGHDYGEQEDSVTTFIAKNWHKYFVSKLYDSDVECKENNTFCNPINYAERAKKYKEQGVKLHRAGSEYYFHGTLSQMFVADSATQSSQSWISNYFPKKYIGDHQQFVAEEEITTKKNNFGIIQSWDEKNVYSESASYREIAVEDFAAFDEELTVMIEYDKSQAMIIATNRCKIGYNTTDKDITEKSDGVKDIEPTDSTDSACATSNGSSSEYCYEHEETKTTYESCTLNNDNSACCVGGNCYSNYGCNAAGGCSVINTETIKVWKFDNESYENDHNYWENGEGTPTGKYKGKDKDIDNVKDCVEQYSKLYDKCVENAQDEEGVSAMEESKKFCPLETYKKYNIPTYKTSYTGGVVYGASKFEDDIYNSNNSDTKVNAVVDNERENWFHEYHRVYSFKRNFNYGSGAYPSSTSTEFNNGYGSMVFFGSNTINVADDKKLPATELVKNIVGVDVEKHNKISGGYAKNVETVAKHRLFKMHWYKSASDANLSKGQKKINKEYIFYNQCLIPSDSDNQCLSSEGNQLSIKNIFSDTGIWDIEMDTTSVKWQEYIESLAEDGIEVKDENDLLIQNAELIIQKIQNASAQYYDEVMNNIIQSMIDASDGNVEFEDIITKRVLPYNVNSMVEEDRERISVVDPRFNETLIDRATQLDASVLFDATGYFANKLLSAIGSMSEITVQMVDWMNFGFFERLGLSPTTMWTSNFMNFLIAALVIWFIVKLVVLAIKFIKGSSGLKELISNFIFFFFILSFLTFTSLMPESTWSTMKNGIDAVTNLGETFALRANPAYERLLKGSTKGEVAYWTPYFDAWSLYNTGYGILDKEQLVVINENTMPETSNLKTSEGLWSLILAESFTDYHGNHYVDDNAYRVVDHFMAPRVTISGANTISVEQNENYNGMYQNNVLGLIPKLLGTALLLFIVFIKFLTFLYLWYMLYMLMINVLLSLHDKRDLKHVFVETFMPAFCMFLIGLWASVIMYVSAISSDFVGLVVIVVLGIVTVRLLMTWKEKLGHFPATLNPVYSVCSFVTNFKSRKKKKKGVNL